MKKLLSLLLLSLVLVISACSSEETEKQTPKEEGTVKQNEEEITEEPKEEIEVPDDESAIDTSMYKYAENIKVTDALEINDHITLIIDMPESNTQGLAFQHVLNQTYDFLLQDRVKEAKTIGINIRQGERKIAMFTVHPEQFVENEEEPMSQMVLDASVVEMTLPEVDQYAETMEFKMKKE